MRLKKAESFCTDISSAPHDIPLPNRPSRWTPECTYGGELLQHPPVRQIKHLVPKHGPNQPARGQHAQRAQAHQHHGVEAAQLLRQRRVVAVVDHEGQPVVRHADGRNDRARLADAPARAPQREEVVPCEDLGRGSIWGSSRGRGRGIAGEGFGGGEALLLRCEEAWLRLPREREGAGACACACGERGGEGGGRAGA